MVLTVLRALFVLLMGAVGWTFILDPGQALGGYTWLSIAIAITLGAFTICIDILSPRRKLLIFSGLFTGLVIGVLASFALSFVVQLLVDYVVSYVNSIHTAGSPFIPDSQKLVITRFIQLLVGVISCYLSISFVLQTGDDFRFIVPYVEFRRQTKGVRPIILDTNVLIDGRIVEMAETGLFESELLVPHFVQKELRTLADSADKLKRNRGRRGQEVLQRLLENPRVNCRVTDSHLREDHPEADVDERLQLLAKGLDARLATTDGPLTKEARTKQIDVINIHDIAASLKPLAMPGEMLAVRLIKPGELPGQGVGYLEDGTMVVVEDGRNHLDRDIEVTVTNIRQTKAGNMIFGRIGDHRVDAPSNPPPRRSKSQTQTQTPAT